MMEKKTTDRQAWVVQPTNTGCEMRCVERGHAGTVDATVALLRIATDRQWRDAGFFGLCAGTYARCGEHPMYELIAAAWAAHADREVLVAGTVRIRFRVLDSMVGRCVAALEAQQAGPVVGFCLPRLESIVVMLACLRAGRTFVPFDPDTATDARTSMLRVAGCSVLIESLDLETCEFGLMRLNASKRPPAGTLDGVMSIMFTSGSTGSPKGVLVRCASVVSLLHRPDFLSIKDCDVFATYSSLAFDASTFEIFTPLLNGNTLVVLDKREVLDQAILQAVIRRESISVFWMTTGLFNTLGSADCWAGLAGLRVLLFGGERVMIGTTRRFVERFPEMVLIHCYGPTENTVFTTAITLTDDVLGETEQEVPIGLPLRGVQCAIRGDTGELLDGEALGVLLVSGNGLSAGYVGEAGGEAFAADEAAISGRFYDTGDEVRRSARGVYYFVGRRDAQVKLNGYRVNLAGIERRCIVSGFAERVHAYVSEHLHGLVLVCQAAYRSEGGGAPITALDDVLSAWERPRRVLLVADWPLTGSGKTDRRELTRRGEIAISAGEKEQQADDPLGNLMTRMTRATVKNRHANLFDLGLDSLDIPRLQSEIATLFGVNVDVLEIYEAGSLSALEKLIHAKQTV